ncbi:MAG TPA: methyltransferase domain-containing protein [Gammaproteobacteria bacterium]|nr:methyltransferase domain-containing protein [Gammaproteobacteria bacterium]
MADQEKTSPPGHATPAETDIWSSYWRGPRLVCSLAGPGIGYPQALVDVWREFFGSLPSGARLLDVATGNGAVAIMANDTAKSLKRRFEIHASDQADINPSIHLRGTELSTDGIVFHARTPAERTGFPDAHFDVITGQFALEYTDIAASVAEMGRILRPGGLARFILHMRDSGIYLQTRRQLADIHLAIDELQILRKAREMMRLAYAFENSGNSDAALLSDARQAREAYMRAARVMDNTMPSVAYKELFIAILQMVAYHWEHRAESPFEQFTSRMDEMQAEIALAEKRHAAMCDHALDTVQIEELKVRFVKCGFAVPSVDKLEITMDGVTGCVGWDLLTRRAGP